MQKGYTVKYLTQAAMIAALYLVLTHLSNLLGLAYGAIQFRLSEVLTLLPLFTPAAIPGLVVGCLFANLSSPFGLPDILCGTLATLFAAFATRMLRNVRVKGVPWLAPLPPVLFNAVIIGLEISFLSAEGFSLPSFLLFAAQVGAGQLAVCGLLGLPLELLIRRNRALSSIFS